MISRIKHLLSLVLILASLICAVGIFAASEYISSNVPDGMDIDEKLENASINIIANNGAEATYEIKDGAIVFTVITPGQKLDDLKAEIILNGIEYDTTLIKEKLGDKAEEYGDYISALENGPWTGYLRYTMTSTSGKAKFTVLDHNLEKHAGVARQVGRKLAIRQTAETVYRPEQGISFTLIFGYNSSNLQAGEYVFNPEVEVRKAAEAKLPLGTKLGILLSTATSQFTPENVKATVTSTSVLSVIIGIFVSFILITLPWELHSACAIASTVLNGEDLGECLVALFKRGYAYRARDGYGGASYVTSRFCIFFSYVILTVLQPIRIVIRVLIDLFCILVGDDDAENTPILVNLFMVIGVAGAVVSTFISYGALWFGAILFAVFLVIALLAMFFATEHDVNNVW